MRLYSIDHNYTDESFVMSVPFTLSGAEASTSSQWAETTVEKAEQFGLIPDSLKGADLTRPITRREFAGATTTSEEATGYANATREQALAISLRIVENLGDGSAASQIVSPQP